MRRVTRAGAAGSSCRHCARLVAVGHAAIVAGRCLPFLHAHALDAAVLVGAGRVLGAEPLPRPGEVRVIAGHEQPDETMPRDRLSGDSRGYGFVTMSAVSEADTAVSRLNDRVLNGLKLQVVLVKARITRGNSLN